MSAKTDIKETFEDLIQDPDQRFLKFFDFYCDVKINDSFSIDKYLRSGKEMLRMGDVYLHEQDFIHAFILYSRYVILYLDKIKSHPEYDSIDRTELTAIQKQIRKSALPKAEKLKAYIKELFKHEARVYEEEKQAKTSKVQPSAPLFETEERKPPQSDESRNSFDLKKSSLSRSKHGLRNVIVPADIGTKFLKSAVNNTSRNIETCGILAGKLQQNVFVVSHCIIPKQSGCSDTCTTEKEDQLFDVIDKLDLITLGWIHTHPSQTAFLSSVDMHSQYSYQIMIPEAIAIVCAPKYNDMAIFILTPSLGLQSIGDCRENGFHAHSTSPPLFEKCDHVNLDNTMNINMIDIRNN